MKITDEVIEKIENIFGFSLYDWQKEYLKGEIERRTIGNGKTFAYCLKLLLSDGAKINKRDVFRYRDEDHGASYPKWFQRFCLEINQRLIENGFKTRICDCEEYYKYGGWKNDKKLPKW